MDPITAIANLITAITNLIAVIAEGQTPEQKQQLWAYYLADLARWRKLFHLDE